MKNKTICIIMTIILGLGCITTFIIGDICAGLCWFLATCCYAVCAILEKDEINSKKLQN